jgi:hypothetical protein
MSSKVILKTRRQHQEERISVPRGTIAYFSI